MLRIETRKTDKGIYNQIERDGIETCKAPTKTLQSMAGELTPTEIKIVGEHARSISKGFVEKCQSSYRNVEYHTRGK